MNFKDSVKIIQQLCNKMGAKPKLKIDGDYGPKTAASVAKMLELEPKKDVPAPSLPDGKANPAYIEARKYIGKKESDSAFGKWLSTYWRGVGLPHYKTIIGASFAWCGLFVFMANTNVGQEYIDRAAAAKSSERYGISIDFKKDGVPQGAVAHVNHNGKCGKESGASSGNHVGFTDGACPVSHFMDASGKLKRGATIPILGGNQGNMVKRSYYPIEDICEIRWPKEIAKPGPVTKAIDCDSGSSSGESTK